MSDDDLEKLASEMKNLRPSDSARERGMDAAMAAFDMEFAAEKVSVSDKNLAAAQGFEDAARPTGQSIGGGSVQAFGRYAMTSLNKLFNMSPRAAMMSGSCMAAFIAAFVVYQSVPGDQFIIPDAPSAVTAEVTPDVAAPAAPKSDEITVTAKKAEVSRGAVGKSVEAVLEADIAPKPSIEAKTVSPEAPAREALEPKAKSAATTINDLLNEVRSDSARTEAENRDREARFVLPTDGNLVTRPTIRIGSIDETTSGAVTSGDPALPSDTVVITRRVVKTPARTVERVVPNVAKTETRRRIKTPASTVERAIPAITKQETRRVPNGDGTFETVAETVVVQAASVEYVTIPATYETYTETVVVQEASTELVTIPATFETISETIKINADGSTEVVSSEVVSSPEAAPVVMAAVTPPAAKIASALAPVVDEAEIDEIVVSARRSTASADASEDTVIVTGRRSSASTGAVAEADSDVSFAPPTVSRSHDPIIESGSDDVPIRYVDSVIPAVTKTRTRRVVKTPTSTVERVIPAITKDVIVQVKMADGSYKEETRTVIVEEAKTELVTLPPVYETVTETVVVEEARVERVAIGPDGKVLRIEPVIKPKPKPKPQSGQLTAGDYDDVLNPDLYKVYLDKMLQGPLRGKDLPYVDANQRVNIRVVDRLGKAVPLADISVRTSSGRKMFPLRTGADGMAYLYPDFDGLKSGTKLRVSLKGGRTVRKRLSRELIENGGDIVVDLKTDRQVIENLDLLLTIDATGSMGDEMRYLQSELDAIIGRVETANPGLNIRTGLVVYRDEGDAYVVREVPFTDDLDDFRESLSAQNANGGGDKPEAMHSAMQTGLQMDWREDALKVNLLVADAPPHDRHIEETWEAGLMSRTQGIHVVPLAASGVDKTAEFLMRAMAQMTGGRFLFLTDDSGIGNSHAKPTVDCYVVTRLDGLVTRVLNSLIKGQRVEPEASDVIRSVGNYRSGTCAVDQNHPALTAQAATYEQRRR